MTSVFESVLRISAEAAVLTLLVFGARIIVGRRPGIMLTVLYALIAIRLIVPLAVSSPLSVHNLWIEPQQQIAAALDSSDINTVAAPQISSDAPVIMESAASIVSNGTNPQTSLNADINESQPLQAAISSDHVNQSTAMPHQAGAAPLTALEIASLIWVGGMIVFSFTILTGNALFMRRIRRNRTYDSPEFTALLSECRQTLGLKRDIRAVCVSETGTAAVYGVFRPVLLISPASFETLTLAQKRHVLLHELSHIRRRDTLVCAGATVLNIVHWFNPLVWLVFALMRRDIEVQCDAHVFKGLPSSERSEYAGTLLKLAGPVQTPRLAPALFISKANIKRRIVMVVKHRTKSALFTAVALLLTVVVAVTGCTTAVDKKVEAPTPEPSPPAVVEAVPEATPAPIPDGYKLIGINTFDYSAVNDKAVVSNIKKAAALLDGTVLPADKQLNLINNLMPLTVENGWSDAPFTIWATSTLENSSEGSINTRIDSAAGSKDMQVGGGFELVLLTIQIAADKTDVSYLSNRTMDKKTLFDDGSFELKNDSNSDVILSLSTENNTITASFYGPDNLNASKTEPELMSSFTVDNSIHDKADRMDNIQKAADMINGVVIKPGETFSINDTLGPRSVKAGWKAAAGIDDAAYVSEIGGGVCAVSSALYNAALRAELEIASITHHSIPLDYIDGGLDAAISTGSPDLKIKNPFDSDVKIESKLDGALLTVSIYGPHMDYTVDFTSERTQDTKQPETEIYYNATTAPDGTEIAPGQSYQYREPRAGHSFNVYKTKYDLNGSEIERLLFAKITYRSYTGLVYVNAPDPATAPTDSAKSKPSPAPVPTAAPSASPTPVPTAVPSAKP